MANRSAHHSISGLHYQFDKSIISILEASDGEVIRLEDVEDIDLSCEYIQCKYHSAQSYAPSIIKKPIVAFLEHYVTSSRDKVYTLYAHFKDASAFRPIDLLELKTILGTKIADLNLSDDELSQFLSGNFQYIHGPDYNSQLVHLLETISRLLSCPFDESSEYYYKNALHEVVRLSRQPKPEDRAITRPDFLSVINKKRWLYSLWLCQLHDQQDYVQHVKKQLKLLGALNMPLRKFIYIDKDTMSGLGNSNFFVLCDQLLKRFFPVGKALKNARPLTIIVDVPIPEIAQLKATILQHEIPVNDGYEHVSFQPWYFNRWPIINPGQAGGRPNDIIGVSSYHLRMITRATYERFCTQIEPPDTFITTGTVHDCPPVHKECARHIHLHSPEFDRSTLLIEVLAE